MAQNLKAAKGHLYIWLSTWGTALSYVKEESECTHPIKNKYVCAARVRKNNIKIQISNLTITEWMEIMAYLIIIVAVVSFFALQIPQHYYTTFKSNQKLQ